MTDELITEVLTQARVIAVVGFSANPRRPSHSVARFLQSKGYRVIPVNPGLAGLTHLGEQVYGTLGDIPDAVDMVDVFRASEHVAGVVDDALTLPSVQVIWTQLDVRDDQAAEKARARGLTVIQDRCPAIEHPRLFA